jgi:hypothetical protein
MSTDADPLFPAGLPFLFAAMWLTITTLLGVFSRWFALQQRYERGDERPLLTLRARSGSMGFGGHMHGILTLSACHSGLRVGIWRLFGPFQRPFLVPWYEIDPELGTSFFAPTAKLHFGRPEIGWLKISARTWQRLAAAAPNAPAGDAPVSRKSAARGLLFQWTAMTMLAGSFFYFASRADAHQSGVPLAVCFVFPAIIFGIGQVIRFVREEM